MTGQPEILLVVARADNGVIGSDGALPWHISRDLRRFKALTVGKPVVMGRRTFASIGRPLPGRHNIVLTRDRAFAADGVTVVHSLADAIAAAGLDPKSRADTICIIGGGDIYAQTLPIATRIELTEVHAAPAGDALFPPLGPGDWIETARERHAGEGSEPDFSFVTLERRRDA